MKIKVLSSSRFELTTTSIIPNKVEFLGITLLFQMLPMQHESMLYEQCVVHYVIWDMGQTKIKYTQKIDVSTLTLHLSYNYHKVASN